MEFKATFGIVVCTDHKHDGQIEKKCLICERPCFTSENYSDAREIESTPVDISHLAKKYICQPCMVNLVLVGTGYLLSIPQRMERDRFLNSVNEMLKNNKPKL